MSEKCPRCGADRFSPKYAHWLCGTQWMGEGKLFQSDKCRIAELEAELSKIKPEYDAARYLLDLCCDTPLKLDTANRRVRELEAENERLRADKERLDWLEHELAMEGQAIHYGDPMPNSLFRRNEPITRAAIDAAKATAPTSSPCEASPKE